MYAEVQAVRAMTRQASMGTLSMSMGMLSIWLGSGSGRFLDRGMKHKIGTEYRSDILVHLLDDRLNGRMSILLRPPNGYHRNPNRLIDGISNCIQGKAYCMYGSRAYWF